MSAILHKVDFLPEKIQPEEYMNQVPHYEKFSCLVERANQWLQNNPQMRVKNCETLEVHIPPERENIGLESSLLYDVPYGKYHLRFLRIWVCHEKQPLKCSQKLRYLNVVPQPSRQDTDNGVPDFEGLSSALESMNNHWRENYLTGSVINTVNEGQRFGKWPTKVDPDETLLVEGCFTRQSYILQTLRIFYLEGQPTIPVLGIKDFAPRLLHLPKKIPKWKVFTKEDYPVFESEAKLQDDANEWLVNQNNMELVTVQMLNRRLSPQEQEDILSTSGVAVKIPKNPVETWEPSTNEHHYIKFLRILFNTNTHTDRPQFIITRSFLPRLFEISLDKELKLEDQRTNISRISRFLTQQGEKLMRVETIRHHMRAPQTQDPGSTYWITTRTRGMEIITYFRIYLNEDVEGSTKSNGFQTDLPDIQKPALGCTIL